MPVAAIGCFGISHHTAPVAVREAVLAATGAVAQALAGSLLAESGVREWAVLSTCNRFELYIVREASADVDGLFRRWLASLALDADRPERYFYRLVGQDAGRHLLRVGAGLDSQVLGEPQILGQITDALETARAEGTVGPQLNALFLAAIRAGKRARSETAISQHPASISSWAAAYAEANCGSLDRQSALVIGAGEMARLAVRALRGRGLRRLAIANRSPERARELLRGEDAAVYSLSRLDEALATADVVLCATAAPNAFLTRDLLARVMPARDNRPLLLVDIAVPRNVEPAAQALQGITLISLDDLQDNLVAAREARLSEVPRVEAIVDEQMGAWLRTARELCALPVIRELRQRAEAIRQRELDRTLKYIGDVDPRVRRHVASLTQALVNQLLHEPTRQLRQEAGNGAPLQLASAVERLFDLGSITMKPLNVGTRRSRLALWQTDYVIAMLEEAWPGLQCQRVTLETRGDRTLDSPLPEIGGKGLFTLEIEEALRRGDIDLAVHSLKDLPVEQPADLVLGAVVGRADVRDVLIAKHGWTLETLPDGARVGTSSLRRRAQLLAARPDLRVLSIRGNVETRLRKAIETDEYDAIILAAAGVTRLGLENNVTQWLSLDAMLPAPGQGALAVQCRDDDAETRRLVAAIENADVRACVTAERAFLQALGGGCATPVGALARQERDLIRLRANVTATDGSRRIEVSGTGTEAEGLGRQLAAESLAQGADRLLPALPLRGKRILVTRSRPQAEAFGERLRARGASPVLLPMIDFRALPSAPLDEALTHGSSYAWLVFTSVNAVAFFFAAYRGQPLPRIAAVGSGTLDRLRQQGVEVAYVPEEFTGQQLALGLGDLTGQRVLLPRSRSGRPEIVAQLRAQGAVVDDIPLYETVAAHPEPGVPAPLIQDLDMITFTSPSSVRNLVDRVLSEEDAVWGDRVAIACIGPTTAAEAERHGLRVAVVPPVYTLDGLIDAIEAHYAAQP